MMEAGLVLAVFILGGTAFWFLTAKKSGAKQLNKLAKEIDKVKTIPPASASTASKELQNKIYALIQKEMDSPDHQVLYKTIDILKLYLGEGLGQRDDAGRITRIISLAMDKNQADVCGYTIHAFGPLLKKSPLAEIPQAVEQLAIIASVAMKRHKNFLTARAVEIILEGLERLERKLAGNNQPLFTERSAKAVKLVGLAVLRGRDLALFREFCIKINEFISNSKTGALKEMWPPVFAAWLNYLARKENQEAFTILLAHLKSLSENNKLTEEAVTVLIDECRHMIAVSSMNPYNTFAAPMILFFLKTAQAQKNIVLWRLAASCAQQATQTSLARHNVETAFPTLFPFLEFGRRLMLENLKTSQTGERKLFAEEALAAVVREWTKTAEYEARKNFILTVSDVMVKIKDSWCAYPYAEGSVKSLNKFCALSVVYWMQLRPKIAARVILSSDEKKMRTFLSAEDLEKLAFLF